MKTLNEFLLEEIEVITLDEEGSAPVTSLTPGVANPDAAPVFTKETHFGHTCISVDPETYRRCIQGKQPFKRWSGYVEDEKLRNEMKDLFYKNKRLLVKNSETGHMSFIK